MTTSGSARAKRETMEQFATADADRLVFGDLLRRYRLGAGLTQEALAERAGISVRGLSDLERGARRAPRRDTLLRLTEALDLSEQERTVFQAISRQHSARGRRSVAYRGNAFVPLVRLLGSDAGVLHISRLPAIPPAKRDGADKVDLTDDSATSCF
jgi:transcriptional regulator with XRE-family HTH domain